MVRAGKIVDVSPVELDHEFGEDGDHVHIQVKLGKHTCEARYTIQEKEEDGGP